MLRRAIRTIILLTTAILALSCILADKMNVKETIETYNEPGATVMVVLEATSKRPFNETYKVYLQQPDDSLSYIQIYNPAKEETEQMAISNQDTVKLFSNGKNNLVTIVDKDNIPQQELDYGQNVHLILKTECYRDKQIEPFHIYTMIIDRMFSDLRPELTEWTNGTVNKYVIKFDPTVKPITFDPSIEDYENKETEIDN